MNSTETQKFKQAYARFQRLLQLQGYSEATCDSYGRGLQRKVGVSTHPMTVGQLGHGHKLLLALGSP